MSEFYFEIKRLLIKNDCYFYSIIYCRVKFKIQLGFKENKNEMACPCFSRFFQKLLLIKIAKFMI